jgi:diguanylate cyclase (GGDEF)-like protein
MRLLDRLGQALAASDDRSTVVILFDVDQFATINTEHGKDVGDELLRQVAHRLAAETRPLDIVARLSGNEFAMVMRKITDVDSALVAADRLMKQLSDPYRVDGIDLDLSVSVGIAVSHAGQMADELVADADTAIAIAKENGGGRIEVMTAELRKSTRPRRNIEEILQKAIVDGEGIEVHYQPIVHLETGTVVSAEALLRIHDDEGALLSPASFLEAAEGSGLIGPLGGQVLQLTCRQLAAWEAAADPDTPREVSVNVSPRQLAEPSFPATVADAIESAGIRPEQLGLEITEGTMIGDRGLIDDTVAAVRNMGVAIGLDDFGAGQSSLGYLKRFPLDFVKIDKELVSGVGSDEGDTAIVRATVELAHGLGLTVVAVGVETAEQLEILQILGADRAQGFYYLPALPADEVAARVREELA